MSTDKGKPRRLQPLSGSAFEIAEGQPDIRSWKVRDTSGDIIGNVKELILDTQKRKVRYALVKLDAAYLGEEDHREVLVPIGLATLHRDDDEVLLQTVSRVQLLSLPSYSEEEIDEEDETTLRQTFGKGDAGATTDRFSEDQFDDSNLYSQRQAASDSRLGGYGLQERWDNSGMEVRSYTGNPGLGRELMDDE